MLRYAFSAVVVAHVILGTFVGCRSNGTGLFGSVPEIRADSCTKDDDCALTSLTNGCCGGCEPAAGTKSSVLARESACRGEDKAPPHCPYLTCPYTPGLPVAVCSAGSCALGRSDAGQP